MKEVLLKKVKYLLEFKYTDEDSKYRKILEKILYSFLYEMEKNYNNDCQSNIYYNELLNRINESIKSIIISKNTNKSAYHNLGFLELSTDIGIMLKPYKDAKINITDILKQQVLKKNYYCYFLDSIKKVKETSYLDSYINEVHSIRMCNMNNLYKSNFLVICPDGTNFNYYMYTRFLGLNDSEIVNMMYIFEVIIGKEDLMDYYLNKNVKILHEFNKKYDCVLGDFKYDDNGKAKYTPITIINELVKRIIREDSLYKKVEYLKKLNLLLFEMFNHKVTLILNSKDDDKIKLLVNDINVLEENMLYNANSRLNMNLEHVKLLKTIKTKINNYLNNDKRAINNEYVIYSKDKKRSDKVTCSVQPINIGNKYVIINIRDVKNINSKILVRIDVSVRNYDTLTIDNYDSLYVSLTEIKYLFSISDLGFTSNESEIIRNAIANRIIDKNIMKIIVNERNKYLGDFVYSKKDDRCIIYKNQSIIDLIGKGFDNEEVL